MTILRNQCGLGWESSVCSDLQGSPLLFCFLPTPCTEVPKSCPPRTLCSTTKCLYTVLKPPVIPKRSFVYPRDFRQPFFQCDPSGREASLRKKRLPVLTSLTSVWKCSGWYTCVGKVCKHRWEMARPPISETLHPVPRSHTSSNSIQVRDIENSIIFCECRLDNNSWNQILISCIIGFISIHYTK